MEGNKMKEIFSVQEKDDDIIKEEDLKEDDEKIIEGKDDKNKDDNNKDDREIDNKNENKEEEKKEEIEEKEEKKENDNNKEKDIKDDIPQKPTFNINSLLDIENKTNIFEPESTEFKEYQQYINESNIYLNPLNIMLEKSIVEPLNLTYNVFYYILNSWLVRYVMK